MATITVSNPDLEAHRESLNRPFDAVVTRLCEILSPRLVAYIANVSETRRVHDWANGTVTAPKRAETEDALRLALRVAMVIADTASADVAQAWFRGLNPYLDDCSPAKLLRDGDVNEDGPRLIAAERAFLVRG